MPLRKQHPGLFRKLRICALRDVLWGVVVMATFPADLVPGGFPAGAVGVAFIAVGVAEWLGAERTFTHGPARRVFLTEKVPLIGAATMWGVSAIWSAWSWHHSHGLPKAAGGVRTWGGVLLYTFCCVDAFNVKAEPLRLKP